VAAAAPVFIVLGIARLLVVALPFASGPPAFFVHAFSQMLVGVLLVGGVAVWRSGAHMRTIGTAIGAVVIGAACAYELGEPYTAAIEAMSGGRPIGDPQGAL